MHGRLIFDVRELSFLLEQKINEIVTKNGLDKYVLVDDIKHHWFVDRLREIKSLPVVFDDRCVVDKRTLWAISQMCSPLDPMINRAIYIPSGAFIDGEMRIELRYGDLYLYF